nr:immunoglobulin heavy chain junction region [Macaca mulatta]MOY22648.1 immunoglobulin heavy chain junction region [Macaca mulatta]MOY22690.1 immunoglobulin heavy chain junction region [Macaca mulatta]MOY22825.1 immunoglobulin heavy chain junction region [Macaca mulatta]MOY23137.1 immunoglobulin heavy chain junction region [Macaca mulatta]
CSRLVAPATKPPNHFDYW